MPTRNENIRQLFYEIDGEMMPLAGMTNLVGSVETADDVENVLSSPECFKGGDITFKMQKREYNRWKKMFQSVAPRCFTNNWRKMHYLPLARRKGKREWKKTV